MPIQKPDWFDMKITLGNLITLSVFVVGFFAWGLKLEAKVDQKAEHIERLQKAVDELKSMDVITHSRIESLRDVASTRQEAVITRLARIETILERVEKSSNR
jgi:FtsZ-binding cell division protein ZapB